MTPPDRVTRFCGCVDFALDVLKNLRIAFIHVTMLNDPFDPYCFFETDFGGTYEGLLRHVKENHPHDMPWFRAHVCARSWGNAVKELRLV